MSPRKTTEPSLSPHPRQAPLGAKERERLFEEHKAVAMAAFDELVQLAPHVEAAFAQAVLAREAFVKAQDGVIAAGLARAGDALAILSPAYTHALAGLRPGWRAPNPLYPIPTLTEAAKQAKAVMAQAKWNDR